MAFKVFSESYPRACHYKKRLDSILPRLIYICGKEFESEHLRRTQKDQHNLSGLERKVKAFAEKENDGIKPVHVSVIGEACVRDVISTEMLVVKDVSHVTYIPTRKHPCVHVVVMEMNPENEQDFRDNLEAYIDQIEESERKYVVIVIIPSTKSDREVIQTLARKHTEFLETPENNFEFEECVVVLPSLEVLKQQEANKRRVTRQQSLERSKSPTATIQRSPPTSPSKMRSASPSKMNVPSPPKRLFDLKQTSMQESEASMDTSESHFEDKQEQGCTSNVRTPVQACSSNEERCDILDNFDDKAIGKAISHQLESRAIDIVEEIEGFLSRLKTRRDKFAGEAKFTDLDKMLYELRGLYNISFTKKARSRKEEAKRNTLSEKLTDALLKVDHVRGCGRIYDKLEVHVNDNANEDQRAQAKTAIDAIIQKNGYTRPYSMRFIQSTRLQMGDWTISVY